MNNCDVTALVDFGKGLVEVRCTRVDDHDNHLCTVFLSDGIATLKSTSQGITRFKRQYKFVNARSQELILLYESGKTLQEIGEKYEVSRQRIQQILIRDFPERYKTARLEQHERRVVEWYQEQAERIRLETCPVCGVEFETNSLCVAYCSNEHERLKNDVFRYVLNPQKHRIYLARSVLNNPRSTKKQKDRAHQMLDPNYQGNRVYMYGKPLEAAIIACKENWPIFDEFAPEYKEYVKKKVDA